MPRCDDQTFIRSLLGWLPSIIFYIVDQAAIFLLRFWGICYLSLNFFLPKSLRHFIISVVNIFSWNCRHWRLYLNWFLCWRRPGQFLRKRGICCFHSLSFFSSALIYFQMLIRFCRDHHLKFQTGDRSFRKLKNFIIKSYFEKWIIASVILILSLFCSKWVIRKSNLMRWLQWFFSAWLDEGICFGIIKQTKRSYVLIDSPSMLDIELILTCSWNITHINQAPFFNVSFGPARIGRCATRSHR